MRDPEHTGRESAVNITGAEAVRSLDERLAAPAVRVRCGAETCLNRSELATLTVLPDPVEPVSRELACELAAGHDGLHVAFTVGTHDGECWWWLRWTVGLRRLVQIDPCDAGRGADPVLDDCLLPDRHPGPHSFDIPVLGCTSW